MIGFDWSECAILRFVGVSFIVWLCYYLLFDRKAPFNQCRTYLLCSVLLAGVISVVRIPVYPVEMQLPPVVQQSTVVAATQPDITPSTVDVTSSTVDVAPSTVIEEKGIQSETSMTVQSEGSEKQVSQLQEPPFYETWNYVQIAWCVYGLGVLVLLIYLVIELVRIWRLKRWGSCTTDADGICIVRNNHVASPFSYFRTIFINRKIEGEVLHIVLLHEKAHICNHHYRDTIFIESLCILCWFNPFVWLIKRELRALHEFQVDRYLLSGEVELFKYQSILFEELMGYSPNIANGFHNSLIKKRFIMMKLQYKKRFVWLRKVALFSLFAGMLALFSFTEKPVYPEIDHLIPEKKQETAFSADSIGKLVQVHMDTTKPPQEVKVATMPETEKEVLPSVNISLKKKDTVVEKSVEVVAKPMINISVSKNNGDLRPDQVVMSRASNIRRIAIRFVERTAEDTRVTIAVPVHNNRFWIQFEKGLSIVDEATKDVYRIRSVTRGIELNKTYWVNGMNNRVVEFTLVFPLLKEKVKKISIRDCFPEERGLVPPGGRGWGLDKIEINELMPTKARLEAYDREGRPLEPDVLNEVTLRPDQIAIANYSPRARTQIGKIETSQENTLVVLNIPVLYDRQWFHIGKGLCIVDCKTGTTYPIQGVKRGIEMNKLLWIEGCKGRSILVTLIFPKLGNKVKTIDLYNKYPDANSITPAGGNVWTWKDVKIKDYQRGDYKQVIF